MKKRIIALTKQSLILFTLSTVIFLFSSYGFFVSEKHILTSVSPDKSYTLEAVLVDGGATTAYSVKVYSVNDNLLFNKKQIYSKYREDNVEINWIDNSTVDINGVILDLEKTKHIC